MNYVVSTTIPFINSGVLKVEPSICFFFQYPFIAKALLLTNDQRNLR